MKILYITEYYPPDIMGGGEISAKALIDEISKHHDVTVMAGKYSQKSIKLPYKVLRPVKAYPVTGMHNSIRRKTVFKKDLINAVKKEIKNGYDIIHVLNTAPLGCGLGHGIKAVATVNSFVNLCPKGNRFYKDHNPCYKQCTYSEFKECFKHSNVIGINNIPKYIKHNPVAWKLLHRNFLRNVKYLKKMSGTIAVSTAVKRYLNDKNIDSTIVPHIVNFSKNIKRIKGLKQKIGKRFVVGSLSSFEPQKGMDILRDAIKLSKNDDIVFLFAGGGSDYKKYIKEFNDRKNCIFLGKISQEEVMHIYDLSSVMTQLSRIPEPMSRIIIESLKLGKPIIGTDVGGNKDGIDKNGYMIKHDPKQLLECITKIKNDKNLEKKMGEKSLKIYKKKFDKESIIKKMLGFYEGLK